VKVFRGTGKGAVLRNRVEYLESAICHGVDKYDLYKRIKAQSSAFGGITARSSRAPPRSRRKPLPYGRLRTLARALREIITGQSAS